jgi:uncharacterized repeat protein (TIGR01451 family)
LRRPAANSIAIDTIIPPGGCQFTVDVTSNAAGSYLNTIPVGALTSTNAGSNTAAAAATLVVLGPPSGTKTFTPSRIGPTQTSTLTIALTNPNAVDITGVAFTDNYPPGLVNSGTPNPRRRAAASRPRRRWASASG